MNEHKWVVRLMGAFAFTAACSNEAPKTENMTVQGTVSSQLQTADAQAVGVGTDGHTFWSALGANGDFKLTLPVGQSYRIVLAKKNAAGQPVSVAYLAITSATGKTQWVAAKSASTIRLGTLVPAGTLATNAATTIHTQSDGTDTMTGTDTSGSGRGGSGGGDTSVSGGSGRGGDDGSGRGGSGTGGDDDDDAFDDDQSHADDPPCHEGGNDEVHVCPAAATTEMESSRNSAEDVSDCGDFGHAGGNDTCSPTPGAGAGGTSGSSGTNGVTDPAGAGSSGAPAGAAAGGAGASSSGSVPVDPTVPVDPGVPVK